MKNLLSLFLVTGFLMGCGTYKPTHYTAVDDLYYNPADDAVPEYAENTLNKQVLTTNSRTSELAPEGNLAPELSEDLLYRKYMYELENDTLLSVNDTLLRNGEYVVPQKKELQVANESPVIIYNDNRSYGRSSMYDDDYFFGGTYGYNNYYDSWYRPFGYNSMYWGSNGWGLSFGSPYCYSPFYSPYYGGHYYHSSYYGFDRYNRVYGNAYYFENTHANTKYRSTNHREGRRLSQSSTTRLRNTGSTQFDGSRSRSSRFVDSKKTTSEPRYGRSATSNQSLSSRSSRSVFNRSDVQPRTQDSRTLPRTSYDNNPTRSQSRAVRDGGASRVNTYTNSSRTNSSLRPSTSSNSNQHRTATRPNSQRTNTYTNTSRTRTSSPSRTKSYSNSSSTRTSRSTNSSTRSSSYTPSSSSSRSSSSSSYTPSSSSSRSSSSSSSSSSTSRSSRRK